MNEIKVRQISLKIGKKKEISLTLEEARELQKVLADLFGLENRVTMNPIRITAPYPVPVYPKRYEWWEVRPTCGDSSGTAGTVTISNTFSGSQ